MRIFRVLPGYNCPWVWVMRNDTPQMISKSQQNKRVKPQKMRRMNILNYKNQEGGNRPETSQSRADPKSLAKVGGCGYVKRQQCDEAQEKLKGSLYRDLNAF